MLKPCYDIMHELEYANMFTALIGTKYMPELMPCKLDKDVRSGDVIVVQCRDLDGQEHIDIGIACGTDIDYKDMRAYKYFAFDRLTDDLVLRMQCYNAPIQTFCIKHAGKSPEELLLLWHKQYERCRQDKETRLYEQERRAKPYTMNVGDFEDLMRMLKQLNDKVDGLKQ